MFKAVINADILKDSIEAISTLVDEAKLKLSKDGISINAVDPANVAMISFGLHPDAFESYECTDGEIGLNLETLVDILSMTERSDKIEIELDPEEHNLLLKMGGLAYTLSLIDLAAMRKEPKVPSLELPAKVTLKGSDLRLAIKAAEKVSDHLALGVDGSTFFMEAESDTNRVRFQLTKDELISLDASGPARSLFSLDYLSDMSKAISKANEVTVHLGKDYPVKINFSVAGGKGKVEYLLAPRIESD
ncbi:MAG: DNA polymerase sliding clamp [Methanocellales archaeon]|nr:DNA polymerase sliding clamp [Methanocellales archaeon]